MKKDIISQNTVVTQVMEEMKRMLSTGLYKPGDKIPTETELSGIFGVGRNSIREAIKIFNYIGVLKSETGIGTHVCGSANITIQSLSWALTLGIKSPLDFLELRDVIEQQSIISLTYKYNTDPDSVSTVINKLENIILELEQSVKSHLMAKTVELDFSFHETIINGGNNSVFPAMWNSLKYFLLDIITRLETELPSKDIVLEHVQILEVIKSGDIEKAVQAHHLHLDDIRRKLKIILIESGDGDQA